MDRQPIKSSLVMGATVAGAAYLLYSHAQGYRSALASYYEALAKVNPIEAEKWRAAFAYNSNASALRTNFLQKNTTTIFVLAPTGNIIPLSLPAQKVSFTEFWQALTPSRLSNLEGVAKSAGYTLTQARAHIATGDIPSHGPSPIPTPPSMIWTGCKATAQIAALAFVGCGINRWITSS